MRAKNLVELLDLNSGDPANGLRFVDRREQATFLSWGEIRTRAITSASALVELGVGRGERVALIHPTSDEFVIGFFAALVAGAVPVPLYPPVRLGRLDEYHERTAAMLEAAGARLLIADKRVRRLLGETALRYRPRLGIKTVDELEQEFSGGSRQEFAVPEDSDLALVQFSSGTTSAPKPVALSHDAVLAQVGILNGMWPDPPPAVCGVERHSGVCWLPLYHDMGLIGCVLSALYRPSELTLIGPELFVARPAMWLRAISRYRATVSPAPSFAYSLCLERIEDRELEGVDLSSWMVALNGAEPVSGIVMEKFADRFARWGFRREALTPVYGMSEAALAVTFSAIGEKYRSSRFDRAELTRGVATASDDGLEMVSLGRPIEGFEIRVCNEQGEDLGWNRIGCIEIKGPSLMTGYLGRPELTSEVMREGWLRSGDRGFLYRDELFVVGRDKEVIIINGRNYSPVEIEAAVNGIEGVRKGCAIAASFIAEEGEERLVLMVEHRHNVANGIREALAEACFSAVNAGVGIQPHEVVVLGPGTLPRTSSGKLRRRQALASWLESELSCPAAVNPLMVTGALARSVLAFTTGRWRRRSD